MFQRMNAFARSAPGRPGARLIKPSFLFQSSAYYYSANRIKLAIQTFCLLSRRLFNFADILARLAHVVLVCGAQSVALFTDADVTVPPAVLASNANCEFLLTGFLVPNAGGRTRPKDLVYATGSEPNLSNLFVLPNNGAGGFDAPIQIDLAAFPGNDKFVVADFFPDTDELDDMLVVSLSSELVTMRRASWSASNSEFAMTDVCSFGAADQRFLRSATFGDFNGDKIPDVVSVMSELFSGVYLAVVFAPFVSASNPGQCAITTVHPTPAIWSKICSNSIRSLDANVDGLDDLLFTISDEEVLVLGRNKGTGSNLFAFETLSAGMITCGPALALADINGDGAVDIVVDNGIATDLMLNNGAGVFSDRMATLPSLRRIPSAVVVQSQPDGRTTMFRASYDNGQFFDSIQLANDVAMAQEFVPISTDAPSGAVEVFVSQHYNFDGVPDLFAFTNWDYSLSVFEGLGSSFRHHSLGVFLYYDGVMAMGDISGDDRDDIILGIGYDSLVTVLYNTGTTGVSGFETQTVKLTRSYAPYIYGIVTGDVTGDGLGDVVITFVDYTFYPLFAVVPTLAVQLTSTGTPGTFIERTMDELGLLYAGDIVLIDLSGDGVADILMGVGNGNVVVRLCVVVVHCLFFSLRGLSLSL